MNREDFLKFVDNTLRELILYAQIHSGEDYSNYELDFVWQVKDSKIVTGRDNMVREISDKVFITSEKIYPCVDLIIEKPTKEKKLKISGRIAGFEPREFQRGWSNRPGPFIYGIGKGIITDKVNTNSPEFKNKLIDLGLLHTK